MTKFKILIKYILLLCFLTAGYFNQKEAPYSLIDADTIRLGKDKIRLKGIDAPETNQICICQEEEVFCGQVATRFLRAFVKEKELTCDTENKDIYGRFLGDCFVQENNEKISISAWLIEQGYAMTYTKTTEDLLALQSKAIREKKGFWACEVFENPADFRKAQKKLSRP